MAVVAHGADSTTPTTHFAGAFVNALPTTLGANITALSGTLTVGSTAAMPQTGWFEVSIDGENLMVEVASATTLTVGINGRGVDGTMAAAHTEGAAVVLLRYPSVPAALASTTLSEPIAASNLLLMVASTASLPQSGTFDVAVDNEHMLVQVASTTLQTAITPASMTLQAASTAGLPATGTFTISVADPTRPNVLPEHMLVSVADATHLTVIARGIDNTAATAWGVNTIITSLVNLVVSPGGRGADGTTAAPHASGSVIRSLLPAQAATPVAPLTMETGASLPLGGTNDTAPYWPTITTQSSFYPSALLTEISRPLTIVVPQLYLAASSSVNAATMANSLQQYISEQLAYQAGAIANPPDGGGDVAVPPINGSSPNPYPSDQYPALPETPVSVTPVPTPSDPTGSFHFQIEFQGEWGYEIFPAMLVTAYSAADGGGSVAAPSGDTLILKESSPVFRVNGVEPNDPSTPYADKYNQLDPSVAMDADGDFVIAWQSVVPDVKTFATATDIFARRFSPAAYVDPSDPSQIRFWTDNLADPSNALTADEYTLAATPTEFTPIEGVNALGNQFQVNTFTPNSQFTPSVGMDKNGDFTIAWATSGQDESFFNGIVAQQFDRDGNRIGNQFLVNYEDTDTNVDPYVSESYTGLILITWIDASVAGGGGALANGKLYDGRDNKDAGEVLTSTVNGVPTTTQPNVLADEFRIGWADAVTSSWDSQGLDPSGLSTDQTVDAGNNFIVSWTEADDYDNTDPGGGPSLGTYAREYSFDPHYDALLGALGTSVCPYVNNGQNNPAYAPAAGKQPNNVDFDIIRSEFRLNSATFSVPAGASSQTERDMYANLTYTWQPPGPTASWPYAGPVTGIIKSVFNGTPLGSTATNVAWPNAQSARKRSWTPTATRRASTPVSGRPSPKTSSWGPSISRSCSTSRRTPTSCNC